MLNNCKRLFHVSEQAGIAEFIPRPSPSVFEGISGDVVFAVSEELLHNYLLPRDCPRVTFYASVNTNAADKERFLGNTQANYVVVVESAWYRKIGASTLYSYELPTENFTLIDECAGYYISYQPVVPLQVNKVAAIIPELLSRNVELRFTPSLIPIAQAVKASSLNFSLIRMRNARGGFGG